MQPQRLRRRDSRRMTGAVWLHAGRSQEEARGTGRGRARQQEAVAAYLSGPRKRARGQKGGRCAEPSRGGASCAGLEARALLLPARGQGASFLGETSGVCSRGDEKAAGRQRAEHEAGSVLRGASGAPSTGWVDAGEEGSAGRKAEGREPSEVQGRAAPGRASSRGRVEETQREHAVIGSRSLPPRREIGHLPVDEKGHRH